MNFVFFKSFRNSKDWSTIDIFENKIEGTDYYLQFDDSKHEHHKDYDLVYNGRIVYDGLDRTKSHQKFIQDITNKVWPLGDDIHGYFSGFLRHEHNTLLFTDPAGIQNIFYYHKNDILVIASNLDSIHKIAKPKLSYAGLIMELIPHYSQFAQRTVFEDVHRLFPGELITIDAKGGKTSRIDYTLKQEDKVPDKNFAQDLVALIEKEHKVLFQNNDKPLVSLSGGIDSRINLAPLINHNHAFSAINYGEEAFIDSKIPKSMARKFQFDLTIINPEQHLFLDVEQSNDIITKTDALYINVWHTLLLEEKFDKGQLFLLGDMLDILRAKGISSMRKRRFRTKYYINKFLFSKKMNLKVITAENKREFQQKVLQIVLRKSKRKFHCFELTDDEQEIILKEIKSEVEIYFEYLEGFNPKYIESYEELFYMFLNGRLRMGKQLNLLRYRFNPEIPLTNIKVLRKVLNVSPSYRYADELTSKMFKTKKWKKLGAFRTAQNPFISYSAPYSLMLLGWFARSKIDYFLGTVSVKTKGRFKRTRLFKNFDYYKIYENEQALKKLEKSIKSKHSNFDFDEALRIFKKRRNKTSWPLASMDLMPYVQVAHYINKYTE